MAPLLLSQELGVDSRWALEHICDGTIGTPVTKLSWAPTSRFMPEGESSITLITLSLDYTARMIDSRPVEARRARYWAERQVIDRSLMMSTALSCCARVD